MAKIADTLEQWIAETQFTEMFQLADSFSHSRLPHTSRSDAISHYPIPIRRIYSTAALQIELSNIMLDQP